MLAVIASDKPTTADLVLAVSDLFAQVDRRLEAGD